MSFSKLIRTSNFRLALFCSAAICIALIFLFGIVDWSMSRMMLNRTDVAVSNEIREVLKGRRISDLHQLTANVARMSENSPEFFYLLQDQNGKPLAGNLPPLEPIVGIREWQSKRLTLRNKILRVRGLGVTGFDNAYLFVGLAVPKVPDAYRTVKQAFIWMTAGTFIALLAEALYVSNRLLARIESISRTSREIISGDIGCRVPLNGTHDEFDHLASSVNAMLDRIQSLMAEVRHVSSDIAHDLRTPLTSMRQRLELACLNAQTPGELRDALNRSVSDMDAILILFSSLLRIAEIEAGSRRAAFKKVDVSRLVSKVIDLFGPAIIDRGQRLGVDVEPNLMTIGDEELLRQLLVNVIDNATAHSPRQCSIVVRAYSKAGQICIEIADSGPGIPHEFKEKVLTPFFRLDRSRAPVGHGLGLSLVAAVASMHHARLELCDNSPGLMVKMTFNAALASPSLISYQ